MAFPQTRLRRLRRPPLLREMVREPRLSPSNFVLPLFVIEGKNRKRAITAMPGIFQRTRDLVIKEIKTLRPLQIPAVMLFGVPSQKDDRGSPALDPHGVIPETIKAIKDAVPELVVVTDVCLCSAMSHGHCGVVKQQGNRKWSVENDETLEILSEQALIHAQAGADLVAPSDMMDGREGKIRVTLDEAGFSQVAILSYAVKYASSFYGPFREAAGSTPQFGDRKSYQMDPSNAREALREAALDLEEGADILMVKPAMVCLDVIHRLRKKFFCPLAAYQVSGEFAMIKAAGQKGWLDETQVMMESLLAIKRAGADLIVTYFAQEAAKQLLD